VASVRLTLSITCSDGDAFFLVAMLRFTTQRPAPAASPPGGRPHSRDVQRAQALGGHIATSTPID
jgi:hypothetical protein